MTSYSFHPFELAFVGYSGSGKTTLIEKLIRYFENKKLGYLKHDAHRFEMDNPKKDSGRLFLAGADSVLINDSSHWGGQSQGELSKFQIRQRFNLCDWLFIEGYKKSKIPKLVFVDNEKNIFSEFDEQQQQSILAVIYTDKKPDLGKPCFHREDLKSIACFIDEYVTNLVDAQPLGLILAGGFSKRMQQDKGALNYHGKTQVEHSYELLQNYCSQIYVSARSEQKVASHLQNFEIIEDLMPGRGPTAGILSAQEKFPNKALFVLACDLPFVGPSTIEHLVKNRDPYKTATCYLNHEKGWPEPLCTLWEPKSKLELYKFLGMGVNCPRKVLFNTSIKSLKLLNSWELDNANTPEDYKSMKTQLNEVSL